MDWPPLRFITTSVEVIQTPILSKQLGKIGFTKKAQTESHRRGIFLEFTTPKDKGLKLLML